MRTFTTEHTVYSYDELAPEAQAKALEERRQREWEYGLDWLEDDMKYVLEELLAKYKIKSDDAKLHYSFSYSQGDGASFTGEIEWGAWRGTVAKNHWGTHYEHWNSVEVTELESIKTGKPAPESTIAKLDDIVHEIGKELERRGYEIIEEALSDETLIEDIKESGLEFYAGGSVA